jgi:hypothetical protein
VTEPAPDDTRAVRLRWLARGGVAVIGLWFLADGLSGLWPDLGPVARVVLVVVAVLAVVSAVAGIVVLARRGR